MKRGHSLDAVLTLVLFSLFTGSVLMVLMMGIQSYQKVATSMKESYEERTCLQYIAAKVDHYSGPDAVTITTLGDGNALALKECIDGSEYITYIYRYNGMAMELFCENGADVTPDWGFPVMSIADLNLEKLTPDLLQISCTGSGGTASLIVELHRGEEDVQ